MFYILVIITETLNLIIIECIVYIVFTVHCTAKYHPYDKGVNKKTWIK